MEKMKRERKNDPYKDLHGKELVDAIIKDNTLGTKMTEKQYRDTMRIIREKNMHIKKSNERKEKIVEFMKPIFFPPFAILFHIITFIFRVVGAVASVTMLYGGFCAYKAIMALKNGMPYSDYAKTAVMLMIFPFIAFAISTLAGKAWVYFDENK